MDLRKSIVVTGASTGIGQACALRFNELGYEVLAGVRKPSDAAALKEASGGRIQPVLLDVTDRESVLAAAAAFGSSPLDGLVNNAGIAVAGPVELVPIEHWRKQMEVNVIGLVSVTQAFLPALRRGRGRIVNIGSIAGRSSLPCSGPYSASKFAVEAISDALRMELAPFGVHVSLIEPGAVATPIWEKSTRAADEMNGQIDASIFELYRVLAGRIRRGAERAGRHAIPTSEVVQAVEHALTSPRPRTRYPVGKEAKTRLWLNRLPDRMIDRLILKRVEAL